MIPLADPKKAINEQLIEEVIHVLKSGSYILGEKNKKFEEEFAKLCNTKHAIAVSSGTSALQLALISCNIGPGDEIITTPNTFIATTNAIMNTGATPIFVDSEPETGNINCEQIENKITRKTKAILPVHLYGHPAEMDTINELASKHGLYVIEDSCQAHGATYKNKKTGSLGDVGCFSFHPSKIMTVAGDGGMITTNNEEIYQKAMMIKNQGRNLGEKYIHDAIGFNYRMSEISASIGRIELSRLNDWIKTRRNIAKQYNYQLKDLPINLPPEKEYAKSVYYVYTIKTKKRNELKEWLTKNKISTGIYYPTPIHLQPAYKFMKHQPGDFQKTEKFCNEILSIPIHQYLKPKEIEYITNKIRMFFEQDRTNQD